MKVRVSLRKLFKTLPVIPGVTLMTASIISPVYAEPFYTLNGEALSWPTGTSSVIVPVSNYSDNIIIIKDVIDSGTKLYGSQAPSAIEVYGNQLTLENSNLLSVFAAGGTNADVSDNELTLTGTTISKNVIGGSVYEYGKANDNIVTITDSEIGVDVYGGYVYDDGKANGNMVTITNSEVGYDVFGGYVWVHGNANNNAVYIKDSLITYDVTGGETRYGKANGNMVTITNSEVGYDVNGGYVDEDGKAKGNTVTITNSEIGDGVYGGYVGENGNAKGNTVEIINSEIGDDVYGGYVGENGNANANAVYITDSLIDGDIVGGETYYGNVNGNSVIIMNSIMADVHDVYGGRADGLATDNNVTIVGNRGDLSLAHIYGGYSVTGQDAISGNNLVFYGFQNKVAGVHNVENVDFILHNWDPSKPIVTVLGNDSDLTNTTMKVQLMPINPDAPSPEVGDIVELFTDNVTGIAPTVPELVSGNSAQKGVAFTYYFEAIDGAGLRVLGRQLNPQTKALSEARLAALSLNNRAGNLVADQGITQAAYAATRSAKGLAGFMAMSSGHDKTETGSHIDVDGISILVGASAALLDKKALTLGGFVETGWGQYTTHNSFASMNVRGSGESSYCGAGLLARYDLSCLNMPGVVIDASLRTGRQELDFGSPDLQTPLGDYATYDSDAHYLAGHIGASYTFTPMDKVDVTAFARYSWTHIGKDHTNILGDQFNFGSLDSNRLRFGTHVTWKPSSTWQHYVGIAYEWECSGTGRATVGGARVSAPSMRGGSVIGSIGTSWQPNESTPLWINCGIHGSAGKTEGYGANVGCTITF